VAPPQAGRVDLADWQDAGGGESGYVTPHPTRPWIVFAGSYGGLMTRKDLRTGFTRDITVYPNNPMGESSEDIRIRFQWTFPIVFSRHNPNVLYAAGSRLFRSTNEGDSWTMIGPEFARADTRTMGPSGGPITRDQTGVETYALIFAFDESPVRAGVLWVGTDDGYVWVSQDNGVTWRNVTPRDIGDFTRVSIIRPSLRCRHGLRRGEPVPAGRQDPDPLQDRRLWPHVDTDHERHRPRSLPSRGARGPETPGPALCGNRARGVPVVRRRAELAVDAPQPAASKRS
jgi:hypothetical protein